MIVAFAFKRFNISTQALIDFVYKFLSSCILRYCDDIDFLFNYIRAPIAIFAFIKVVEKCHSNLVETKHFLNMLAYIFAVFK